MSASNKGLLVVVGVGVASAAALAGIYFKVVAPRSRDASVRAEIDRWGGRWHDARRCLVGDAPRSVDGFEALILREMIADADLVAPLRACQPGLRELRREVGPDSIDTGAALEKAWSAVIGKVAAVAEAHAWRVSPRPNREPAQLRRALGQAVAGLDQAYVALRESAGMTTDPPAGPELEQLAAGRPLADPRGRTIQPLDLRVGASALVARGEVGGQIWIIRQAGAAAPELTAVGPEVVAARGQPWGAWSESGALRVGPLDAVGDPATDGALLSAPGPGGASSLPLAALTDGPVRVVLHETGPTDRPQGRRHWISRSVDGATWPERLLVTPPASQVLAWYAQPELDRIDLVWAPAAGGLLWLPLAPGRLSGPFAPRILVSGGAFEPGTTLLPEPCVAGDLAWWNIDGVLHVAGADGPAEPVPGAADLAGPWRCAGDRLVAIATAPDGTARILLCRPGGCSKSAALPGLRDAEPALALDPKHGPLIAFASEGLVVVWSGDPDRGKPFAPVAIARLPRGQRLVGLVPWAGAPTLVTLTDDALRLIPMSLSGARKS